jgi:F-type H+-transporting ATPase subunit b
MKLIEQFGVDPILIAAQIINFLVILYILKRFLYKPLFKVFKERQDLIKASIEKAEASTKALAQAQAKEKAVIKEAQTTATQILKDAKEQSVEMINNAEEATKKQTDKMITEAKEQIAQEAKKAEVQLDKHVAELSVILLKKSLENVFTEEEQSKIVKRAIEKLK